MTEKIWETRVARRKANYLTHAALRAIAEQESET